MVLRIEIAFAYLGEEKNGGFSGWDSSWDLAEAI